jgi:aldehyde dehydrogenase (NAD+)
MNFMDNKTIINTIESQRVYFSSGATKKISFRTKQLKVLRNLITENDNEILEALSLDLKKPAFEAQLSEIQIVVQEIDHFLDHIQLWAKETVVPTPIMHKPGKSIILKEPYGVALIIAPWNYPFQLLVDPLVGAIAAGNCALLKPSEITVNTSKLIAKLFKKYFDEKYIAVIEGGVPETQLILAQKFDYIFYTGSTAVGKVIMEAAAKFLTPVTLELGGKSPCIVDKNVNIKQTAKKICWGKFFNAGQTCIAPDYLLVEKSIKQELLEAIKQTLKKFYGENPLDSSDYTSIVSERHFNRLTGFLSDGNLVCGGSHDISRLRIEPTVLDNINWNDEVMKDEIFGPVLPVLEYENVEDAIKIINEHPKPLALYIFSRSHKLQYKILNSTSSGGVCINDILSHITTEHLPFGGVGNSGMGSYHGKKSFDTFTHEKSVLRKSFLIDMPVKYPPYVKLTGAMKRIINLIS